MASNLFMWIISIVYFVNCVFLFSDGEIRGAAVSALFGVCTLVIFWR